MLKITTLEKFVAQQQKEFRSTGELSGLLLDLATAAKIISSQVRRAGIGNILGSANSQNASGEQVQKLDILADQILQECLHNSGHCCAIASEENEDFVPISSSPAAKYVVLFDPLDGSSNIDVNVSIGTIFAIYKRESNTDEPCSVRDFLRSGAEQVAAGYALYGSSTMLVYATQNGTVNGFTLDDTISEFCLSHPNMRIPKGRTYSVNYAKYAEFHDGVQAFVSDCVSSDMEFRYIGSMVADVHRTLIKGGIFMYPATKPYPKGKLRLLYECNPLAFIVQKAGGLASDGYKNILDLEAEKLHQRTPIFIGAAEHVQKLERFIQQYEPKPQLAASI